MECFFCKQSTKLNLDWHCRHCSTTYHFACEKQRNIAMQDGSVTKPYSCAHCNMVMSDITIGHWALATYEHVANREGHVFDVLYIYKGVAVVVQPYILNNGVFVDFRPFIGAQCPSALNEYIRLNFDAIVKRLKGIKLI